MDDLYELLRAADEATADFAERPTERGRDIAIAKSLYIIAGALVRIADEQVSS